MQTKDIHAKAFGLEHPDSATSLNTLAALYRAMGAYEKAEPRYLQAKDIRAKALGTEHPVFVSSLNNLAELYRAMGAYEKAEPRTCGPRTSEPRFSAWSTRTSPSA